MGHILLEGGSEFEGWMGRSGPVGPKAGRGPGCHSEHHPNGSRTGQQQCNAPAAGAVAWFRELGATNVSVLPLIDNASADDPNIAADLEDSALIFILGGFPGYLARVLTGSRAWQAIEKAHEKGAVIAGSSAGAMVLCQHFFDPKTNQIQPGLDMFQGICVLPHHNAFGASWAPKLAPKLPHTTLMALMSRPRVIFSSLTNQWRVSGKGVVTLYRQGWQGSYSVGKTFSL